MRKVAILLVFLCFSSGAWSQVINFGKTLPIRAYSLTLAPIYNAKDNPFHPEARGVSGMIMGGYGLKYDLDLEVKYAYFHGDAPDMFAAELQYLFRETRRNYYSIHGGVHKWKEFGLDGTFSFTYTPNYDVNLSAGVDIDVDITEFELRAWIPLNIGFNIDDRYFLFLEYDMPATERAWDIFGGGVTFIFR